MDLLVYHQATIVGGLVPFPTLVLLIYMAIVPVQELDVIEYVLPALATAGLLVYGLFIPITLHRKLRMASKDGTLDDPDTLNRYGFLLYRYKPGRW